MQLTLDSSVIVAALRKQEQKHTDCKSLLQEIILGSKIAYIPYIVLVEVSSAIKRRTSSSKLAHRAMNMLIEDAKGLNLVELNKDRAEEAAKIAIDTGIRGMDAIFIQVAKEFRSTFVTLDEDVIAKVRKLVDVMDMHGSSPLQDSG